MRSISRGIQIAKRMKAKHLAACSRVDGDDRIALLPRHADDHRGRVAQVPHQFADESRLSINPSCIEVLARSRIENIPGKIIKRRQLVGLQHRLQLHRVSNLDVRKGSSQAFFQRFILRFWHTLDHTAQTFSCQSVRKLLAFNKDKPPVPAILLVLLKYGLCCGT